jgi:hypothetical protein
MMVCVFKDIQDYKDTIVVRLAKVRQGDIGSFLRTYDFKCYLDVIQPEGSIF